MPEMTSCVLSCTRSEQTESWQQQLISVLPVWSSEVWTPFSIRIPARRLTQSNLVIGQRVSGLSSGPSHPRLTQSHWRTPYFET
jgi:hypothetical protein